MSTITTNQDVDYRLATVQDTIEVAAHHLKNYADIAADTMCDVGDFKGATVALDRVGSLLEAQAVQIAKLMQQVDAIVALRRQMKAAAK
jgi:hypothetical protein